MEEKNENTKLTWETPEVKVLDTELTSSGTIGLSAENTYSAPLS